MPRESSRFSNPQSGVAPRPYRGIASAPLGPTALARLNFTRSHTSLALPRISNQPASYTHVCADDQAVTLARTFVEAGLGSLDLWQQSHGDCVVFLRSALNEYLKRCGADGLDEAAVFGLSLTADAGDQGEPGHILAYAEAETAGDLRVGHALSKMENVQIGLGRDFYLVLIAGLSEWTATYDMQDAEELVERWRESVQNDMDPHKGETVEQYCRREDIHLPDVEGDTPSFLRDLDYQDADEAAARLRQYRGREFKDAVAAVLKLWGLKRELESALELDNAWEAAPLPGWVVYFQENDAIMQSFDEESNSFLEYSHSPSWLVDLDPANLDRLRGVLQEIRHFVEANLAVAEIQHLFQKMEEAHGGSGQHRERGQLCA